MPLTLKQQTAVPPRANMARQQRAFDEVRAEDNAERPHEAIGQRPPAPAYTCSPRPYPARTPSIEYPAARALVRR